MLQSQWYKEELSKSDADVKHRSLSEEYSFFEAVKEGNIEFVQENCKEEAFSNPEGMGVLSKNALTNLKYHFVITVALVTRYCIEGGMETEQAYRLSDFYILHMDACTSLREISDLHHVMALDFTGKCVCYKKMPHYPNRLPNASTTYTPTSVLVLRLKNLQHTLHFLRVIFHAFLNRIWVYRSATIYAKKKSKKRRISCAFPIIHTSRLPTIFLFLPRVTLFRHLNIMLV